MARTNNRKRGGQPGNTNALKHGFYSSQFKDLELTDLDENYTDGLEQEIKMLRVVTRRVMELSNGVQNLGEAIETLNVLGLAAIRLSSLLRVQKLLGGNESQVAESLSKALTDIMNEMDIHL